MQRPRILSDTQIDISGAQKEENKFRMNTVTKSLIVHTAIAQTNKSIGRGSGLSRVPYDVKS